MPSDDVTFAILYNQGADTFGDYSSRPSCTQCHTQFVTWRLQDDVCAECQPWCSVCRQRVDANGEPLDLYINQYSEYKLCPECRFECNNCGRVAETGDSFATDIGDVCYDCTSYCDDCDQSYFENHHCRYDSGAMHDYSYKPMPRFYGVGADDLYFGVEIELESKVRDGAAQAAEVLQNVDVDEDHWYAKHDSSLSDGVEFVSHPRSIDAWMDFPQLDHLLDGAKEYVRSASTTGIHVHMSMDAFRRPTHLFRFLRFHYVNCTDLAIQVAGRDSEEWARFEPGGVGHRYQDGEPPYTEDQQMRRLAQKKGQNWNRYVACNLQNTQTVELRYFRSTVQAERVRMYIEWLHSIYKYTERVRASEMSEKHYRAWLRHNVGDYPRIAAVVLKGR